jgi:hypothetical protein
MLERGRDAPYDVGRDQGDLPVNRVHTLIGAAIGLMLASTAFAQTGGFGLAWHDCIGLPSAAQNLDFACDGNPFKLVVTFTPPSDLVQFVGIQVWLGMRSAQSVLPDWWRLGVGECREGLLAFPGSRARIGTGTAGACVDPWGPAVNTGGGLQWTSDTEIYCGRYCLEYSDPGSGALKLAFARDTSAPLQAGQRYLLAPILIEPSVINDYADSCLGCAIPACLFVRAVELYQNVGQIPPQQDIYYLNETSERQYVTWQGGGIPGNACPLEVPVRRTTWGAIKAIYR